MPVSALCSGLLDDAALFPPGDAPMAAAVPAHRAHRTAWYRGLVGPFLCPASRLAELAAVLDGDETAATDPLGVAVVMDTGTGGLGAAVDAVAGERRLDLRGVEVPLRAEGAEVENAARRAVAALDAALGGADDDFPAAVEVPWGPAWRAALEVLSDAGYRAKVRTGGASPDAFPPADRLAELLVGCLDLGVPVKATAGLHRAARHTDLATGLEHHGFLNLLLAVEAARGGAGVDAVTAMLEERDARLLADRARALDPARQQAVRRWFGSFGTCSINGPVDDLVSLGLLVPGR